MLLLLVLRRRRRRRRIHIAREFWTHLYWKDNLLSSQFTILFYFCITITVILQIVVVQHWELFYCCNKLFIPLFIIRKWYFLEHLTLTLSAIKTDLEQNRFVLHAATQQQMTRNKFCACTDPKGKRHVRPNTDQLVS